MVDPISGDDYDVNKVREAIPPVPAMEPVQVPVGESQVDTIEESKLEKAKLTLPPASMPVLAAPTNMESVVFAIASLDASGRPMTDTVTSFVLKGEEIKNNVLEGWMKNLREIEEYVRQLLNSPVYQRLEEIRRTGDPQSGTVSGVQGVTSANAEAKTDPVNFLSTLDRLQALDYVPPSAEVSESSSASSKEASHVLVLPLTAALLAGGLVAGTEIVQASTHPLGGGVLELIDRVKDVFPQVSIQDLIPVINLMVVAPIYFNSWNEAVSNIKSRERHSYVQTVQNFAKDVIKIVNDPNFVQGTLINRMRGTKELSPQDQERLARMLKVVLIGIALSLLYSAEVGKVYSTEADQKGKFAGITPEELRDLLRGNFTQELEKKLKEDPNAKLSEQERLTLSLIRQAKAQLDPAVMSDADRLVAANMLVDYVTEPHELDPMLDPAKAFDQILSSSNFNVKDKVPPYA
jgi:hypothetical protein